MGYGLEGYELRIGDLRVGGLRVEGFLAPSVPIVIGINPDGGFLK